MAPNCVACGKPLGAGTGLCYSCQSEGERLDEAVDVDEAVRERVERYFVVSSVRCSECGDIHGEVTLGGETYTADDFGIESVEAWELEMDKEEEWLADNAEDVRDALAVLEPEWPRTADAVRTYVLD